MACLACGRRAGPSDQRAEVHLVMRLASKLVRPPTQCRAPMTRGRMRIAVLDRLASYVHQHNAGSRMACLAFGLPAFGRTVAPLSGGFRKGPLS